MTHGSLSLLLGPDRTAKLRHVQELVVRHNVDPLDQHRVDGASITAPELVSLCRQGAAASARRLIVVDDAQRLTATAVGALLEHAGAIRRAAHLILLVEAELTARHPLAKLQPEATVERFAGRDGPPVKPFALTDALGRREAGAALTAAHEQFMAGREPFEVLSLISWQVQRWVAVKRLAGAGQGALAISGFLNLKPWQVERLSAETARWTLPALEGQLRRVWRCEADVKTGRAVPQPAVEALIVELCA